MSRRRPYESSKDRRRELDEQIEESLETVREIVRKAPRTKCR